MPFIVRSNLLSFTLDLLFNIGLGFFCLSHFNVPTELRSWALTVLATIYIPRSLLFFGYRTAIMWPMHRWLQNRDKAEPELVRAATKAAYEASLKSNIVYTVTFVALYGCFTYLLWQHPRAAFPSENVAAGVFLSLAVGMGAFALGYPLNIVVNSKIASPLSLLCRQNGWKVEAMTLPLQARVPVLAFCLTGTPCFMMLSAHATYTARARAHLPEQGLGWLAMLCLLLFCWALLSAILMNLTISRPVKSVKSAVEAIFAGDTANNIERVPVAYPDELGVLAEGTNRMLDQLESSGQMLADQLVELEQANEGLREATRVKGEFLASMSHELRTPLNAIIGFSKILLRKTEKTLPERQFRNIQQINKSGKQLLSLVNDILDFEKIEAGRLAIIPEEVDCNDMAQRLTETFKSQCEEAGLELSVESESSLVLWTDAARLTQVLSNFVVNAIKYAGEGTVTVRFQRRDEEIWCSVSDQGPGISSERREAIFEAFQQLSDGKAGVGLGLAIVSRLAALMGGRIELDSQLGEGSTFSLVLPASHEVGELGLERLQPEGEGPDLLVVDDQPDFLEMMHSELTEAGYRVHLARSGEQALEMLEELKPAAVLLDIVMPGQGGWETLRQIRSRPETADLPVVISSVLDDTPVGLELGITGWLTKPLQGDELKSLLSEMGGDRRVLLVDDDEPTTEVLGQVLEEMGRKYLCAHSGQEALDLLKEHRDIGAVVLDLGLPDIDGFEVLDALREMPGGKKFTVVAYTGRELTAEESERLQNSLARVVQKHASNSVTKVLKAATGSL